MYENLKAEMARVGITNEMIAEDINSHRNTVSNKINGDTDFTIQEAMLIRNLRFPHLDFHYLFKRFPKGVSTTDEKSNANC